MASRFFRLTLAIFRDLATSIGCVPGRNQRYQSVADVGEFLLFPSPKRFARLNSPQLATRLVHPIAMPVARSMLPDLHVEPMFVNGTKCGRCAMAGIPARLGDRLPPGPASPCRSSLGVLLRRDAAKAQCEALPSFTFCDGSCQAHKMWSAGENGLGPVWAPLSNMVFGLGNLNLPTHGLTSLPR
jgi:hypothetical protein